MAEEDLEIEVEAPAAPKKKKKLLIMLAGGVLLLAGVGAAVYFTGILGSSEASAGAHVATAAAKKKDAIYVPLDPSFTVNLQGAGPTRYFQVGVELLTRDPGVEASIKRNGPMIRNNLVLLFSSKTADELKTLQGKESLREEALKSVRSVLQRETGAGGVEAVLFTSFVMQ